MSKVVFIFYFIIVLLTGFYFGYVGLTVAQYHHNINSFYASEDSLKNIKLDTMHAMNDVLVDNKFDQFIVNEHERLDKRVPLFRELNSKEALIILSLSFGLIGGLMRILYNAIFSKEKAKLSIAFLIPVLSSLSGLLTYFITMYIENMGSNQPDPDYFLYAALVGGIFTKSLFDQIEKHAKKSPTTK